MKNLMVVLGSMFVVINVLSLSILNLATFPSSQNEFQVHRGLRANQGRTYKRQTIGQEEAEEITRIPHEVPSLVEESDYIYRYNGIWDASPIVLESHKLIFFSIPKAGCTTFKQLFRRMMGYQNWQSQDGLLMLPHNPFRNGLKYLYDYSPSEASEMMTSPKYTRAIFVRDPKMRFLSAFLDKALSNGGNYLREKCCPAGECIEDAQTLGGFLDLAQKCKDTHWMPQNKRIDAKYWKYINFVGHLETAESDTKRLLQSIGAWEEFGRSGWGKLGNTSIFENPADAGVHATWSRWSVWKWYTQALERKVEDYYRDDYSNSFLNFTATNLVEY